MKKRTRKFIGMLVMVAWIPVYAGLVLAVVISPRFLESGIAESPTATFFFYLVAGLAWTILPAILIRWMQRPD